MTKLNSKYAWQGVPREELEIKYPFTEYRTEVELGLENNNEIICGIGVTADGDNIDRIVFWTNTFNALGGKVRTKKKPLVNLRKNKVDEKPEDSPRVMIPNSHVAVGFGLHIKEGDLYNFCVYSRPMLIDGTFASQLFEHPWKENREVDPELKVVGKKGEVLVGLKVRVRGNNTHTLIGQFAKIGKAGSVIDYNDADILPEWGQEDK